MKMNLSLFPDRDLVCLEILHRFVTVNGGEKEGLNATNAYISESRQISEHSSSLMGNSEVE